MLKGNQHHDEEHRSWDRVNPCVAGLRPGATRADRRR